MLPAVAVESDWTGVALVAVLLLQPVNVTPARTARALKKRVVFFIMNCLKYQLIRFNLQK